MWRFFYHDQWVCRRRLLRAMDARKMLLQKEQGLAFARASAAGFDMQHMERLLVFCDCFGATRLRYEFSC
jgi:hypothetical protein